MVAQVWPYWQRWLWIIGAIFNAIVITMFIMLYIERSGVLFSVPSLITKSAQIILEIGLIFLLVSYRRENGRTPILK